MASLVDQIFGQIQGASAQGEGFGDAYFKGKQLSQDQQRINLSERQLAAELSQLPLKQTLNMQEAALNEAKLAGVLEERQAVVNNEAAFQQLTNLVSQKLAGETPAEAQTVIWDAISRNRGLWRHPGIETLLADTRAGMTAKLALEQARAANRATAPITPEIVQLTDPVTGKPVSALRTGPNSYRELRGEGETIEFTSPSGETVKLTRGGGGGGSGVPTAITTKAEETLSGAVSAAKLGATLINKLRPEDLGILGKGGEIVVDETLAQVVPSAANLKRIDARTLLRLYRNDFTRALKFDSQLSNEERSRIESMLPGEGARESLPSALQKIKTATREVAQRARFNAQRANRPIPNELLLPQELLAKVKAGELTADQAIELAKTSPFRDEFDSLLQQ